MKRLSPNNPYRSIAFPVVSFEQFLKMHEPQECWVRMSSEAVSAAAIQEAVAVHPWAPFTRLKSLLDGSQLTLNMDRKAFCEELYLALEHANLMSEFAVHELIRSAIMGGDQQITERAEKVLNGGVYDVFGKLDDHDIKNLNGLYGIGKNTSILGLKNLCENLAKRGFVGTSQALLDSHQERVS
jgi:hypothetical protein